MSSKLRTSLLGFTTLAIALNVSSAQAQTATKQATTPPAKPAAAAPKPAMAAPAMKAPAMAQPAAAAAVTMTKSEPAKDASGTAPKSIKIWLSGTSTAAGTTITLTGAGGTAVALGKVTAAKNEISAPVTGKLADGMYTVTWGTTSAGHPANGTFNFTVKAPMAAPKKPAPKAGGK